MSTKLNAEELAAKRYPRVTAIVPKPNGEWEELNHNAAAYAAAIREVAQPIADERDEYRDALEKIAQEDHCHPSTDGYWDAASEWEARRDISRAILAKYPKP